VALRYANLFACQVGIFPLKYLGAPIATSRLHVVGWARMEEKSSKKLDVWQGNSLSITPRVTEFLIILLRLLIMHPIHYLIKS
jgi:hypothetical protein